MTGVIVFSGPSATQIIADTLGSKLAIDTPNASGLRISSGIIQDSNDIKSYEYHDRFLKIAKISETMAIGLSGSSHIKCNSIIRDIFSANGRHAFHTIKELIDFFERNLFPSHTPSNEQFALVGMLITDDEVFKFKADHTPGRPVTIDHSCETDVIYCIGSGATELTRIWLDRDKDALDFHRNAGAEFQVFAEELYIRQFFDGLGYLEKYRMGGSITGAFARGRRIFWHPPTTIIILMNTGGTGLDARWEHTGFVSKLWEQDGSAYLMTFFDRDSIVAESDEQGSKDIIYSKTLFSFTNCLSKRIELSELDASAEAASFNSSITLAILLPCGSSAKNATSIAGGWEVKPFVYSTDALGAHRFSFNSDFSNHLLNECYVTDDYKVLKGKESIQIIHDEFERKFDACDPVSDPGTWLSLNGKLALQKWHRGIYVLDGIPAAWSVRDSLVLMIKAYHKSTEISDPRTQRILEQIVWILNDLKKNATQLFFMFAVCPIIRDRLKKIPNIDHSLLERKAEDSAT